MQQPHDTPHTWYVDAIPFSEAMGAALAGVLPPDLLGKAVRALRAATGQYLSEHPEVVEATAGDRTTTERRPKTRRKRRQHTQPPALTDLVAVVEQINDVADSPAFGPIFRALLTTFEHQSPQRRQFIDAVLATPAADRSPGDDRGAMLLEMTATLLVVDDLATLGPADGWARGCLDALRDPAMVGAYPPSLQRYPIPRYPARDPRIGRLCEVLLTIPDHMLARMARCDRRYAARPCWRYLVDRSRTATHHPKQFCGGACRMGARRAARDGISGQAENRDHE